MSTEIRDYIEFILPKFLSTPEGRAFFRAFNDGADELIDDLVFARAESLISQTTPDTLDQHLLNSSLLKSPYEFPDQVKSYLLRRFDTWLAAGTRESIQADLARFGYRNTKVIDWADLILSGVPHPFGGGFVTIPGANPNGGLRYCPLHPYFAPDAYSHTIEQRGGINQQLGVYPINIELTRWYVQLKTDGAGNVVCTALDVYNLIRSNAVASKCIGVAYTGTGLGAPTIATTTNLPTGYNSFFFVDIDTPNGFLPSFLWDDGTDTTYDYPAIHPAAWHNVARPSLFDWYAIWGIAPNDIWVVGATTNIYHYDGTAWTSAVNPTTKSMFALWGNASNNIWAVGATGTILHYDGTNWSSVVSPTTEGLGAIWGTASNNIWAVGDKGTILHYDGTNWADGGSTGGIFDTFYDIWGSGPNDIWAVGGLANINKVYHYDGTSWSIVTTPMSVFNTIQGVFGFSASDIWFVGTAGKILHYDGVSFAVIASPTTDSIQSIWGFAPNDIWAGTLGGEILHYNGTNWTIDTVYPATIYGIWGFAAEDVWAVKAGGDIARYSPYPITVKIFSGGTGVLWDGGACWDLQPPYPDAITDIIKIIRKWKPARMSCRFVRIRVGDIWYPIPIGEQYEEDADGNLTGDFYYFNY